MGNPEYNKVSKGFLWSLWNLIPLIGFFIYLYKVVTAGIGPKQATKAVWVAIGLMILAIFLSGTRDPGFVNVGGLLILGGIIILWIIVIKYIGFKFFLGSFIIPLILLLGLSSAIIVPRYIDLEANAKHRAINAAIAKLNSREKQIWEDQKKSAAGWVSDDKVLSVIRYDLGNDFTWPNGLPPAGGRTLSFRGLTLTLNRTKSTATQPAGWRKE